MFDMGGFGVVVPWDNKGNLKPSGRLSSNSPSSRSLQSYALKLLVRDEINAQ